MAYRTIVADPPWPYADGFISGPGHGTLTTQPLPYPSMTVSEIERLPVDSLARGDCRLFLWTTNRFLPNAFGVIDAWGFSYRQTLVWHKRDANLPHALAPNVEFLLVAVRGKPKRIGTLRSAVVTTTLTKHSVKPEVFSTEIERVSPGPYVELFARRARPGWDVWGNEAPDAIDWPETDLASAA